MLLRHRARRSDTPYRKVPTQALFLSWLPVST